MEALVASAKESMAAIIARQPDDSTYDEILRELAYARMVQRGLQDSDAGRTVSDDEIARRIDSWQK
jgi:predicted transcriptional regulator